MNRLLGQLMYKLTVGQRRAMRRICAGYRREQGFVPVPKGIRRRTLATLKEQQLIEIYTRPQDGLRRIRPTPEALRYFQSGCCVMCGMPGTCTCQPCGVFTTIAGPVEIRLKIGTHPQQLFYGNREPVIGETIDLVEETSATPTQVRVDIRQDMGPSCPPLFFAERM